MEQSIDQKVEFQKRNSAFNRRLFTFAIVNKSNHIDIEAFLKDAFLLYKSDLQHALNLHNMVK